MPSSYSVLRLCDKWSTRGKSCYYCSHFTNDGSLRLQVRAANPGQSWNLTVDISNLGSDTQTLDDSASLGTVSSWRARSLAQSLHVHSA